MKSTSSPWGSKMPIDFFQPYLVSAEGEPLWIVVGVRNLQWHPDETPDLKDGIGMLVPGSGNPGRILYGDIDRDEGSSFWYRSTGGSLRGLFRFDPLTPEKLKELFPDREEFLRQMASEQAIRAFYNDAYLHQYWRDAYEKDRTTRSA